MSVLDGEQSGAPRPEPLRRDADMPKLSDVVMLDRGCQLWIREARAGSDMGDSKTLGRIRYRLRLERRMSGAQGKGGVPTAHTG